MLLDTPTYDLDDLFSVNYHIHTNLSRCGRNEMTAAAIVEAAERAGLREIALTDHIHPGENAYIKRNLHILKPEIEALRSDGRIYLGVELSAYGAHKYTLRYAKRLPPLEYRLYAHNHYQMDGWEQPEDRSPAGYKAHCKRVLAAVIRSGKAQCLAHPFIDKYIVREFGDVYGFTFNCVTSLWTENELGDLLQLGRDHHVAWELNTSYFAAYPDLFYTYYNIGREIGVCFHTGTDAHSLAAVDPAPGKALLKRILTQKHNRQHIFT